MADIKSNTPSQRNVFGNLSQRNGGQEETDNNPTLEDKLPEINNENEANQANEMTQE